MQRRSFLKFLGAAPVAAPVIAREAAVKAGVRATMPVGTMIGTASGSVGGCALPRGWLDEATRFLSASAAGRRAICMEDPSYRHEFGSALDPDLASSRSLSLSAALRIQRERNLEAYSRLTERRMLERYLDATGAPWGSAIARGVEAIKSAVMDNGARKG